jgi:hypothetical protein
MVEMGQQVGVHNEIKRAARVGSQCRVVDAPRQDATPAAPQSSGRPDVGIEDSDCHSTLMQERSQVTAVAGQREDTRRGADQAPTNQVIDEGRCV